MRLIAIFLSSLVFFVGNAPGQCTLAIAESPALVNLKLGMSPPEVNGALGGAATVKVKNEDRYSYFKSFKKQGKAKGVLTGAKAFYVRFYDGRVYQIEVFYHRDYRWSQLETLVRDYSAETGFAAENFVTKYGYAKAECDGFTVKADYVLNPHIEISDSNVIAELKKK